MLYFTIALPFLYWLWLGTTFTIMIYALRWAAEKGLTMEQVLEAVAQAEQERPARIVRYTSLNEPDMPGLLSFYEEEKNILHIDRDLAETLPRFDRDRLEMTEITFTRLASQDEGGLRFKNFLN